MRFVPFLVTLLFSLSCSDDSPRTQDCAAIACTEEFRSFSVSVTDASGAWIPLDVFEVLEWPSREDITVEYSPEDLQRYRQLNAYPLLSDERALEYQNRRVGLRFRGFIGGNLVVEADFTGGADCCHVEIFDGSLELIVE